MKVLLPDSRHRTPTAVGAHRVTYPVIRSFEIEEPVADLSLGQVLLPEASGPCQATTWAHDTILNGVAVKCAAFYPSPRPGALLTISVGGSTVSLALDYLFACWPTKVEIEPSIGISARDTVIITVSQPSTVVLFGIEHRRER